MDFWSAYSAFSEAFLAEHHDVVLWHTYHQLKAWMLFPCGCPDLCDCAQWREKVRLSLDVTFYNKALENNESADKLLAIKIIFGLPEAEVLRKHFPEAYPLWLVEEKIQELEKDFKLTSRLTWMLIRLACSYSPGPVLFRYASIREALKYLLGNKPLKPSEKDDYLGGEKAHIQSFKIYRFISPFVTAGERLRDAGEDYWNLSSAAAIEKFLGMVVFVRHHLLTLATPHTFHTRFFDPEELLSPPVWVQEVEMIIEPIEEKLKLETEKALSREKKREEERGKS